MAYHVGLATQQILFPALVSDNLHSSQVPFRRLDDHRIVALEGPEAVAFAHAQFASDVTGLMPGQWQWSTWLTAKGRVIAVFALARPSEDRLLMVLPDADAGEIAGALARFVFRRKLKIGWLQDWDVAGRLQQPDRAHGHALGMPGEEAIEIDLSHPRQSRSLLLRPSTGQQQIAEASAEFTLQWRQHDLLMGLPRLARDQVEQWTPQQLGLDHLEAYSVRKGCYPGQEIVARTHFLGKAKRATRLLTLGAPADAGAQVLNEKGDALGTLASVAGNLGLAILPLDLAADTALRVGDAPALPAAQPD